MHLFAAEWRKNVIDKDLHNYGGFTKLIKTCEGNIVNTGNYHFRDHNLQKLDNQLCRFFDTFVESHFINILPGCEVGEHFDIYDYTDKTVNVKETDFINTSILFPVFGTIEVESNGYKRILQNDRFFVIDTSKKHNGWNKDMNLSYCSSSLVYQKTYEEIKEILSKYILEDLDV
jgi:hypothetical protein